MTLTPGHTHDAPMKIVLWGTYDTGKPRLRILRDGLRRQGVEVTEIHADVWADIEDKSSLHGIGKWLRRGCRIACAYPGLVWRYLRASRHDLVLVAYPGQLDMLVLRLFAWLRHTPVAFDWFISAYDTIVLDRKLVRRAHPIAWLAWLAEWLAAHAADIAFMDTATHARRMEKVFHLRAHSVGCVWVGAEELFFNNRPPPAPPHSDLRVLFYGQFIPLHGVDVIIGAARRLRDAPVHWTLVGRGQAAPAIRAMLAQEPLPKLSWIDWVTYADLPGLIADADVCLGIFGTSDKAASVIPNKVFQIVAMGRPLVTRDSSAIRELLPGNEPCMHRVRAGDADDLAAAILDCLHAPRNPGRHCFVNQQRYIDANAIGARFLATMAVYFPDIGQAT